MAGQWIFAIAIFLALFLIDGCSSKNYDSFAQCLTDNGVKMYGAFWCPHCQNQKDLFGSSFGKINYIECSLPDGSGQTNECTAAGINGYPTWEFKDGSRIEGEATFRQLGQKTGCKE